MTDQPRIEVSREKYALAALREQLAAEAADAVRQVTEEKDAEIAALTREIEVLRDERFYNNAVMYAAKRHIRMLEARRAMICEYCCGHGYDPWSDPSKIGSCPKCLGDGAVIVAATGGGER